MDKRLVYTKVKHFNNSFQKSEYKKIPCKETNLNQSGEKTFIFNFEHMLAYLHESMIMEIFEIKDTVDEITLQNDFYPDLYSSAKILFGSEDIESITTSVGEASTIMRSVSTSETSKRTDGALSGWFPDSGENADADNKGFIARREYYNGVGKTTIKIFYPLRFLFGIFNDYRKVFYQIPNITLILNRKEEGVIKRIFFGSKLKTSTAGVDIKPSYIAKKLEWWIPILTPNLTAETFFHNQLNNDKNIEIASMKHRMTKTTFNVSDYTWSIAEVTKHVRYVFIGFKTDNDNIKKNNNLFTIQNIRKVQVSVNGEEYPEIKFNSATGDVAEPYLEYIKSCEFFGYEPQFNIKDYTTLYPIISINTTNQPEKLTGNSVSIRIEKDGTDQYTAYCLLLEESHLSVNLEDHSIRKL
jgi:hypothetical protein